MNVTIESQKTIDTYLSALRRRLSELRDEDVNDIVEEIRAHILDKTSGGTAGNDVAATLAALGTPEELAARYRSDELLQRAQITRSPLTRLHGLFRWATLSIVGFIVFFVSVFGYALGGGLVIMAGLKVLWPHQTGLWKTVYPDGTWGLSFSFSSGNAPAGHELLGWWSLPICLILGTGLLFLTFRFGSWSLRKFWRPRVLQPA